MRTVRAVPGIVTSGCLLWVLQTGCSEMHPKEEPSALAARLTLATLRGETTRPNLPVRTYLVRPLRESLAIEEVVRYLAKVAKPISCRAQLTGSTLEISCVPPPERGSATRLRARAELEGAYLHLLNERCEHPEPEHLIQVTVGEEVFVFPLAAILAWVREYEMPYSLVMWTRKARTLPTGVCAAIDVRPAPAARIVIESDDEVAETD